jgi:hypothetical protein
MQVFTRSKQPRECQKMNNGKNGVLSVLHVYVVRAQNLIRNALRFASACMAGLVSSPVCLCAVAGIEPATLVKRVPQTA